MQAFVPLSEKLRSKKLRFLAIFGKTQPNFDKTKSQIY